MEIKMDKKMESVLDKIRGVQALAEHGKGGEALNAARVVFRLLAKHNLTLMDLQNDPNSNIVQDHIESQFVSYVKPTTWERRLARIIGQHCSCRFAFSKGGGGRLVGYTHDIEVVEYLYTICRRQIIYDQKQYLKSLPSYYDRGDKVRKGNEFKYSAVLGLKKKLKQMRESVSEEVSESDKFSLMTLKRMKNVDEYVDKNCRWTNGRRTNYQRNSEGFRCGRNVTLNTGISSTDNNHIKRLK